MGWFNKILVQKVDTGELVDITDLDKEHYESFLDVTERLKIAYKVAIERGEKPKTTSENSLHKHFVSNNEVAVCVIHGCHNTVYKRGVCRECYLKLYNTY